MPRGRTTAATPAARTAHAVRRPGRRVPLAPRGQFRYPEQLCRRARARYACGDRGDQGDRGGRAGRTVA
ncbi:hypothetical protein Kpho02_57670 [Kitasatospora phosalacinea]|uniref:Uncharacterized protein n=1 Tax=Kitasatospora phosalacinea TaxID=2065 RepID=A0A9W6QEE7_9ACTN|nr:hypothetical protein [Kitasatospora phosalacinea]GLW73468.1 hypothetical protein Kpho02_57670 [Kitasatospora phosalacinea]